MLAQADGDAANQVDQQNQDGGDRVAADELGSTVHRAEEVRLLRQLLAAAFGGVLIDRAGVEVGVDRHLLAGHGIQGEAGIDLGDAACALGHHHEVHDGQNHEDDETDHIVAGNHELAEGGNHLAGRLMALMAVHQHHPGRGHVQREAQHRGKQQHRGEGRELQGLSGVDGDHDHHQTHQ